VATIAGRVRNWKKWIGFVVVGVIVAAFGVAAYLGTRPPERELDAQDRAWVSAYQGWSAKRLREAERALVEMTFDAKAQNARVIEPLRTCFASMPGGEPPEFLTPVRDLSFEACGRAERAVELNDEFDVASLAQIKQHLGEAADRLRVARRTLREELAEGGALQG
jgi:hypothetical protein